MRIVNFVTNKKTIFGNPRIRNRLEGETAIEISGRHVLTIREVRNALITGGIIGILIPIAQGLLRLIQ